MPIIDSNSTDDEDNTIVVLKDVLTGLKTAIESIGGKNRLLVDSTFSNQSGSDTPGCPVFSKKYRAIEDSTDITIGTGSYTTLYSYSGSGKFIGFMHEYDDKKIIIRVTIDGTDEIMNFNFEDFFDFLGKWKTYDSGGLQIFRGEADRVAFFPSCPIEFSTSVLIEAIATSGTHKLKEQINFLTKET